MDPNSINTITQATGLEIANTVAQFISSVVTVVAVIITACVAIRGINAWRREFRGKRQIELAEDALTLFYQAKDAIAAIRNPFGFAGEGSTRERRENETADQTRAWDMAYVATERYKRREAVFSGLQSLRYRFMAQIGKKEADPFEEIRHVLNEISVASDRLADIWPLRQGRVNEQALDNLAEQAAQSEAIFWSHGENDEISRRVNEAVSQMDQTCGKIIVKQSP
jgi:hypothetical protein